MSLLVIGDVHGSLYTFKELLNRFWDYERDMLIQVGDLIDRGNYSPDTVKYCRELYKQHPNNVIFLKGNHEFEIIEHFCNGPNTNWLRQCGAETMRQYQIGGFNLKDDIEWFSNMPLSWSNEKFFISHAGIAEACTSPFNERDSQGLLWNRSSLKNIEKLQVVGHTPCEGDKPFYNEKANCWNIDTGAGYGVNLTALRFDMEGCLLDILQVKTQIEDNPS